MASSFKHFTEKEAELLKRWQAEGKPVREIAGLLQRDETTIRRQMKSARLRGGRPGVGRPRHLSPKEEAKIVRMTDRMIEQADGEWQVTADMVKKALKLKCCTRVILNALHKHNFYFHAMRQKPMLTKVDVEQRSSFAEEHYRKPATFWTDKVHAFMDNKFFPTYLNAKSRAFARKSRPHGTFRAPGQGLGRGHVKPRKDLKQNFGPSVNVAVAISSKKVLMCHVVSGAWNAKAAVEMYTNALAPALQKEHPGKRSFLLLEDNDPTGYKSNKAKDVKKVLGVNVLEIPKRSPDLNPLDYAFWSEVNKRLRTQEAKFADNYTETRCSFARRLRRTILRIGPGTLRPMVSNMKRRCMLLREASGRYFEEGK